MTTPVPLPPAPPGPPPAVPDPAPQRRHVPLAEAGRTPLAQRVARTRDVRGGGTQHGDAGDAPLAFNASL